MGAIFVSKTTLTHAGQIHEAMLMADQSMDAVRSAVNDAVRMACMDGPDDQRWDCYVVALFPGDVVVYRDGEDTFRATYTIDLSSGDPVVTLGSPVEVEVAYVDSTEPADESARDFTSDLIPLVESALRPDGTLPVKVIAPGWGSSGYYSAEVLKRDGPKIFPKGTHQFIDHPGATESRDRPERSIRDLGAVTVTDAEWRDDPRHGPGLYANAKPVNETSARLIEDLSPFIGVSIRAAGRFQPGEAEGRKGPIITSLERGDSIDFVTVPGAGGKVLQLMESARNGPGWPMVKEDAVNEAEARALQESMARLTEESHQQAQTIARLTEAAILREAQDLAAAEVQRSVLPDLTKARVIRETVAHVPLKEGAIDREVFSTQITEAVRQAAAEVNQALGGGAVRGLGAMVETNELTEAQARTRLEESFRLAGMSESSAKLAAATGR